ncbi:MAG: PAS domain S-box protein [Armatimonadetes bacterium]|nr:PAS domain S-box protein [Armatimonadota bacterium]
MDWRTGQARLPDLNSGDDVFLGINSRMVTPEGVCTAVLVNGYHYWVDGAYCDLFARTSQELLGQHLAVLFDQTSDDPAGAVATILQSADTETHHEFCTHRRDGKPIWVSFSARRVLFDGRGAIRLMVRDITAQKNTDDAIRESERRFRQLADLLPEMVFECDTNLRITYANRAAFEILGQRIEALEEGICVGDFLAPRDAKLVARRLARAGQTRKPTRGTYELHTKDGRTITCEINSAPITDANGVVTGFRGLIHDITERRRHEEALVARQRRLKTQSDALVALARGMSVQSVDIREHLLVITETAAQTLCVERASVWLYGPDGSDLYCADLFMPENQQHTSGERLSRNDFPAYFEALSEARTVAAVDALHDPRTHELAAGYLEPRGIVSMLDAPIRLGGELVGIVCHEHTGEIREWQSDEQSFAASIADMVALCIATVERARTQQQLEQHARELERSNAELERFAAVASHDLKTPLSTIASFVQLIDRRHQDDEVSRQYIGMVLQSVERMVSLMDDLLDYARVGSRPTVPQPTDMNQIIEGVTLQLRRRIDECGGTVDHDDLPVCMVDPGQMHQLFHNLVTNSLKFRSDRPPRVHVRARCEGHLCHLTVSDNGIGIPEDQWDRIFRVFERGSHTTEYPGTGVGLSICQRIVSNHGGKIWVDSSIGNGANFHVLLPLAR